MAAADGFGKLIGKAIGWLWGKVIGRFATETVVTTENVTKSSFELGQKMHKAYKSADVVDGVAIKEFRLPSGKRIDFLDIANGTIYE